MIFNDQKFLDSARSYFINQLDSYDPTLNMPLIDITYGRDIKLRTDISIANESTSYQINTFGGTGTQSATGKPWIAQNTNALTTVSTDSARIVTPVRPLSQKLSYSIIEYEKSIKTGGQSIDTQQFDALNQMQQQSTDEMVYLGDTEVKTNGVSPTGLVNSSVVASSTVPADGAGGLTTFASKTREQVARDLNNLINSTALASGYAVYPDKILMAADVWAELAGRPSGTSSDTNLLEYLRLNNASTSKNGRPLEIEPLKYCTGAGAGGTNRMVAYTNNSRFVRFPLVPIQRVSSQIIDIWFSAAYLWAFGELEIIYPETLRYADGI